MLTEYIGKLEHSYIVNGAVKWVNDERVVLAINNRGLDADKFWFSLFHEIRHVFQRKIKTVFISYNEKEKIDVNNQLEEDANIFATNYLCILSTFLLDIEILYIIIKIIPFLEMNVKTCS